VTFFAGGHEQGEPFQLDQLLRMRKKPGQMRTQGRSSSAGIQEVLVHKLALRMVATENS